MATISLDETKTILIDAGAEAMAVIHLLGEYNQAIGFWELWSKCPDAMERSGKSREDAERNVRERLKTLRDAVETVEPVIERAEPYLSDAYYGVTVADPDVKGIEATCWPRWALECAKTVTRPLRAGESRPFRQGPQVNLATLETHIKQQIREAMRRLTVDDADLWRVPSERVFARGFLARHDLPNDLTAAYKLAVRLLQSCCRTRGPIGLAWVSHDPCDVLQELDSLLIDAESTLSPVMAEAEKRTTHLTPASFHRYHAQTALGLCIRIAKDTHRALEIICQHPFLSIDGKRVELEGRDEAEVVQLRRDATADHFIRTGRITFGALEGIASRLQKEILAVAAAREERHPEGGRSTLEADTNNGHPKRKPKKRKWGEIERCCGKEFLSHYSNGGRQPRIEFCKCFLAENREWVEDTARKEDRKVPAAATLNKNLQASRDRWDPDGICGRSQ